MMTNWDKLRTLGELVELDKNPYLKIGEETSRQIIIVIMIIWQPKCNKIWTKRLLGWTIVLIWTITTTGYLRPHKKWKNSKNQRKVWTGHLHIRHNPRCLIKWNKNIIWMWGLQAMLIISMECLLSLQYPRRRKVSTEMKSCQLLIVSREPHLISSKTPKIDYWNNNQANLQ